MEKNGKILSLRMILTVTQTLIIILQNLIENDDYKLERSTYRFEIHFNVLLDFRLKNFGKLRGFEKKCFN